MTTRWRTATWVLIIGVGGGAVLGALYFLFNLLPADSVRVYRLPDGGELRLSGSLWTADPEESPDRVELERGRLRMTDTQAHLRVTTPFGPLRCHGELTVELDVGPDGPTLEVAVRHGEVVFEDRLRPEPVVVHAGQRLRHPARQRGSSDPRPPPPDPSGPWPALSGRVVDPDGAPIPRGSVTLWQRSLGDDRFSACGQHPTDADGRFAFTDVGGGETRLSARAPGFAPSPLTRVRGSSEQTLVLDAGIPFDGRVLGRDGKPLPGATVTVFAARPERFGDAKLATVVTDARGEFRMGRLPRTRVILLTTAPDLPPNLDFDLELAGEVFRWDVQMGTGLPLLGKVVPAQDEEAGVAGARIGLMLGEHEIATATSNEDGEFSLPVGALFGPDDDTLTLEASAPSRGKVRHAFSLVRHIAGEALHIALPPARSIAGQVLGVDGKAAAAARVRAMYVDESGKPLAVQPGRVSTDDAGRYSIDGVRPDSRLVIAAVHETGHGSAAAGEAVRLETGGSVRGTVKSPDGQKMMAAWVTLTGGFADTPLAAAFPAIVRAACRTDAEGTFQLTVPAGRHAVRVVVADGRTALSDPFEVRRGETVASLSLTLPSAGEVRLSARHEGGRSAITGVFAVVAADGRRASPVRHYVVDCYEAGSERVQRAVFQRLDGRFVLPWLRKGTYTLVVRARGLGQAVVDGVRLDDASTVDLGVHALAPARRLRVTLTDGGGATLPGDVSVRRVLGDNRLALPLATPTIADGGHRLFLETGPGEYELVACPASRRFPPVRKRVVVRELEPETAIDITCSK